MARYSIVLSARHFNCPYWLFDCSVALTVDISRIDGYSLESRRIENEGKGNDTHSSLNTSLNVCLFIDFCYLCSFQSIGMYHQRHRATMSTHSTCNDIVKMRNFLTTAMTSLRVDKRFDWFIDKIDHFHSLVYRSAHLAFRSLSWFSARKTPISETGQCPPPDNDLPANEQIDDEVETRPCSCSKDFLIFSAFGFSDVGVGRFKSSSSISSSMRARSRTGSRYFRRSRQRWTFWRKPFRPSRIK